MLSSNPIKSQQNIQEPFENYYEVLLENTSALYLIQIVINIKEICNGSLKRTSATLHTDGYNTTKTEIIVPKIKMAQRISDFTDFIQHS